MMMDEKKCKVFGKDALALELPDLCKLRSKGRIVLFVRHTAEDVLDSDFEFLGLNPVSDVTILLSHLIEIELKSVEEGNEIIFKDRLNWKERFWMAVYKDGEFYMDNT